MIAIDNAGHCFQPDRWLFRRLSLQLAPGRITAILGPNGCGKTTLLRALTGAISLREGSISSSGTVGFVPQAIAANHALRAADMVLLGRSRFLGRFSVPGPRDEARAAACLDEVGLGAIADRRYDQLSGGQRQLVLLARALASDCDSLILDEPGSALDLANQGIVLRLLARLAHERRLAVLFTTHHPEHALGIADRTLLMLGDDGHIEGPSDEVLDEANLSRLYGVRIRRLDHVADDGPATAIIPLHGLHAAKNVGRPEG